MSASCPQCGFSPPEGFAGESACGRCGVVFAKALAVKAALEPAPSATSEPTDPSQPTTGFIRRGAGAPAQSTTPPAEYMPNTLRANRLTRIDPDEPILMGGIRAGLLLLLAFWGWRFAQLNQPYGVYDHHFLHNALLIFHEAGHLLFIPFGRFMTIAGGSLMQLLVPLIVIATFLFQSTPNPFGAAVGVWWLGISLIDLSPYIGDAQSLKLMMIGGFIAEDVPDAHDWRNTLYSLNLLRFDREIASAAHYTGSLLIGTGLLWGAYLVLRQIKTVRKI
ncbi:MAG: hypothetical protein ACE5FN_09300 [Leptospirillia bacterium]